MNNILFDQLSKLEMTIFAVKSAIELLIDTDSAPLREYLIDNLYRHAKELDDGFKETFDHLAAVCKSSD